jgi:hypothetical protein
MKGVRLLVAALGALAAIAIVAAGPAAASSCRTVRCLRKQVSALSKLVKADTKAIKALNTCLYEAPVSLYGDSSGANAFGYAYSPDGGTSFELTDALDATPSGDQVSAWVLTDGCNTSTTASVRMSALTRRSRVAGLTPIAPVAPLMATFPLPRP